VKGGARFPQPASSRGTMGSDPAMDTSSNHIVVAQLNKTKMCIQFQRGSCRESSCRFAHSLDELRAPPDLAKTAICRAFSRGMCAEADCKFAHGEQELRVSPSVYKTQLCNFFARGHCKKGERCRHAHGRAELREFQVQDENRIENDVYVDPGVDSPETFKTPKKDSVRAPPGLQPRVLQDLSNRDLGDSPDIFTTPKKAYKENMMTSPSSLPMKVPLPGQTPLTRVPGCDSPALSWPDEECDPPANQELSSEQLLAAARAAAISAQEHAAAANALQSAAALAWARAAVDPGNSVDFDPLLALLSRQTAPVIGRQEEGCLPRPAASAPKGHESKRWVL